MPQKEIIIDTDKKDSTLPAVRISKKDRKQLDALCKRTYGHELNSAFIRELLFDHFGIKQK